MKARDFCAQRSMCLTAFLCCYVAAALVLRLSDSHVCFDSQASSPDEVALVKFAERAGLILKDRSHTEICLRAASSGAEEVRVRAS